MGNDGRITFAIAVFDELRWLRAAVIHLLQSGFKPKDLFLVAEWNAFNGELKDEWERDDDLAWHLAATWIDEPGRTGLFSTQEMSSRSSEARSDCRPEHSTTTQDLANGFHNWLIPDYAKELDQHLTNGFGALFVSVLDEGRVAQSCQVLLRYASCNVQTHQVML